MPCSLNGLAGSSTGKTEIPAHHQMMWPYGGGMPYCGFHPGYSYGPITGPYRPGFLTE